MTPRPRQREKTLDDLAEWLLGDSVAFRKLDDFRTTLKMDDEAFAHVLGIAPSTYKTWRRNREVPLSRNREKCHGSVGRYQVVSHASQNGRFEPEFGHLARQKSAALVTFVPSKTTPSTPDLSYYPPLGELHNKHVRQSLVEEVRRKHLPQRGDDYDSCECSICK